MKIPSLFKSPRYQRFKITPRYYDPIKEEIEQRTSLINRQLNFKNGVPDPHHKINSRIAGAFKHEKFKSKGSAGLMQMVIIMLLVGGMVGYLYFGNIALYIFLLVSSVLLYLKIKHIL